MSFPANTANLQRSWVIYKITNPNGRVYIGKTSSFGTRMKAYRYVSGGGCNQQPLLHNSLLKYGFGDHKVEILESFKSDTTHADGKEMFWIRSFMSNLNKWRDGNGMNLTDGGEGSIGHVLSDENKKQIGDINRGKKMSAEKKKHLSDYFTANPSMSMLGKKMSQESKDKMSEAKKGKTPHWLVGVPHTEEYKKRSSDIKKGKPSKLKGRKFSAEALERRLLNPINTAKKKVQMFDADNSLIQEFKSIREASRFGNVSSHRMDSYLSGINNHQIGDFYFKLKN